MQPSITLITPTVAIILVDGITIPTSNIAWAGPVDVRENGQAYFAPDDQTTPAYRVRLISGGHVDLPNVTADGFASILAGAAF